MWRYRARVDRIVDGDSVAVTLDLGFRISLVERLRLSGLDADEPRGATRESGLAASRALASRLPPGSLIVAETAKSDKYDRWLARVYDPDGVSVNDWLLTGGHAKPWVPGGGR